MAQTAEKIGQPAPIYSNRYNRRSFGFYGRKTDHNSYRKELRLASGKCRDEIRNWNQVVNTSTDPYTIFPLYQLDEAQALVTLAEDLKYLSFLTNRAINEFGPNAIQNQERDVYTLRVSGLSLADMEEMTTPLPLRDIRRINNFFQQYPWEGLFMSSHAKFARRLALNLPIATLANPEIKAPQSLRTLNRVLTDYFDYYASWLNYPNETDRAQLVMLVRATVRCGLTLFGGLGAFMPARLGITPASTIRLFEEQSLYSLGTTAAKLLSRRIEPVVKNAYKKDGLPGELANLAHYDKKTEEAVSKHLRGLVQVLDQKEKPTSFEGILTSINHSLVTLKEMAREAKNGIITIALDHPLFQSIKATSQSRRGLMLAAQLKGCDQSLVLEVNGDNNRIYGIPVDLLKENPHSGEILAAELFPPLLSVAYQRSPALKSRPVISVKSAVATVIAPDSHAPSEEELTQIPEIELITETPKSPKRKTTLNFFQPKQEEELPPHFKPEITSARSSVIHSRTMVRKFVGTKVPEFVVDNIMAAIHRYEMGKTNQAKTLSDFREFVSLRVGDHRVIMRNLGHGVSKLIAVQNRSEVYGNKSKFRLSGA